MENPDYNPEEFRSPAEAAKMLGVSPKTIQLWVENGTLRAWKTAGGHRRITLESIMTVVQQREQAKHPAPRASAEKEKPVILVVEDEANLRRLYELGIAAWRLPIKLETAKDGFEALVKIGETQPQVVITDLHMPGMDGFQMLHRLKKISGLADTLVIVVTSMSRTDIETRGGLPKDLPIFFKPVPFERLKESITAHLGFNPG